MGHFLTGMMDKPKFKSCPVHSVKALMLEDTLVVKLPKTLTPPRPSV